MNKVSHLCLGDRILNDILKVYVGYDSREDIAWQVCCYSIMRHTGPDVDIYPLKLASLRELGLYTRSADNASTEFSLTRFLTPYLAAHDGWSIFVDCDFLFTGDIRCVFDYARYDHSVCVVQHNYVPANMIKMDGQIQTNYPRKNWSSFMLFNGRHNDVKSLTPQVVNTATPAFLHRLSWVSDTNTIGALPLEWNFLVGEYPKPNAIPMAIHYTNGGPWFDNWQHVDFAENWRAERDMMNKYMVINEIHHVSRRNKEIQDPIRINSYRSTEL